MGGGPLPQLGYGMSSFSLLDPWGSTLAILASLKSDKETKKVCKGPPFPPLLVFCQAVSLGHPHPRARRPPLQGFSSSPLAARNSRRRSRSPATRVPIRALGFRARLKRGIGSGRGAGGKLFLWNGRPRSAGSGTLELSRAPRGRCARGSRLCPEEL